MCAAYRLAFSRLDGEKTNHMIVVTAKMNVLLISIVDKFYVPPSDPAAQPRDIDLAVAKGYYSHPSNCSILELLLYPIILLK